MTLSFKNVDFTQDLDIFINFRKMADKEVVGGFNHDLEQISNYINRCLGCLGPEAFMHIYDDNNTLIGQIELSMKNNCGYIHLFYLLPKYRGRGYFKIMHDTVMNIFCRMGVECIQLATTISNKKAISIYEKYGWANKGLHLEKTDTLIFEYHLDSIT